MTLVKAKHKLITESAMMEAERMRKIEKILISQVRHTFPTKEAAARLP